MAISQKHLAHETEGHAVRPKTVRASCLALAVQAAVTLPFRLVGPFGQATADGTNGTGSGSEQCIVPPAMQIGSAPD